MKKLILGLFLLCIGPLGFAAASSPVGAIPSSLDALNALTEFSPAQQMQYANEFWVDADHRDNDYNTYLTNEPTQAKIWQMATSQGWPQMLTNFQKKFKDHRSYVALFEAIPMQPMDMRSPEQFRKSIVPQSINSNYYSIGHMTVGWSCEDEHGRDDEGYIAQSGENGQTKTMLDAGWGLTGFLSTYTDGYLHTAQHIQMYFSNTVYDHMYWKEKVPPFFPLVVEVSHEDCLNVRNFAKAYVMSPKKPFKNFGMTLDPNKFEGAGCGSFAISLLSKAKSLAPLTATFWRDLEIPNKLFGRLLESNVPENTIPFAIAKNSDEIVKVSKYKLAFEDWNDGSDKYHFHFVDPELSIFAFRVMTEAAAKNSLTKYQAQYLKKLKRTYNFGGESGEAVLQDEQNVKGFQEINESFDPSFNRVSEVAHQLLNDFEVKGMKPEIVNFPYGIGLFIGE